MVTDAEVRLRQATDADRDWLRVLHGAAYAVMSGELYDECATAWERGFFSARTAHPTDVHIISRNGVDVGAVYLEHPPDSVFIESLEVHPDHQGRGAGSGAIDCVVGRAEQAGMPVTLHVHKANPRARALYERHGFSTVRETDTHVVMQTNTPMTTSKQNEAWAEERSKAVAAAIRATVPRGLSGMDYGCGPGHVGLRLADHFATLALIDADPHVVEELAEKVAGRPSLRTHELDLTRQPSIEQVDCVFASMSFHHVRHTTALLDGIANTIRPGGWLVIADFDTDQGQLHSAEPGFDGHHGFDRSTLAAEVAAHGFVDICVADVWAGQRWCGDLLVDYSMFLLTARRAD